MTQTNQPDDMVTQQHAQVAENVLAREARRRGTLLSVSLPVCLLLGVALFSSMSIESIYIVGGGAVAGLVLWAALINLVPLTRGSWAYNLLLAGDRTASEEESLALFEQHRTDESQQENQASQNAESDSMRD